ncbi:hypothetical protein [Streptomyces sp. NPDC020817]|uniref:hypothetical protein n=1 Tax=Streptomyces sp. NPDC020817 TaxID=3365095 RepID=UPI0037B86032
MWLGHPAKEVLAGFPADMFVVLVAVTFLFGMARANGTVDWMVHSAVRVAGNRVEVVPWVLFLLATLLCATGAAFPAAVAIVAPIGITFAVRHGMSPLYAGLMAVNGAAAGGFAPTGILGGIVHSSLAANDLHVDGAAALRRHLRHQSGRRGRHLAGVRSSAQGGDRAREGHRRRGRDPVGAA